jgi:hypothetical protein
VHDLLIVLLICFQHVEQLLVHVLKSADKVFTLRFALQDSATLQLILSFLRSLSIVVLLGLAHGGIKLVERLRNQLREFV